MLRRIIQSSVFPKMRFSTVNTPEGVYSEKDVHVKNVTMAQDLDTLQRQIIFRSNNLGMKELDLVVGSWAKKYAKELNLDQCIRFHNQVLEKETPELFQIVLNAQEIDPQFEYLRIIQDYAFNAKDKDLQKHQ